MTEFKNSASAGAEKLRELSRGLRGRLYCGSCSEEKIRIAGDAEKLSACFRRGERVINALPNSIEWWKVTLAALFAGATVAVLPGLMGENEIRRRNGEIGAEKIFSDAAQVRRSLSSAGPVFPDGLPCDGNIVLFTSGTQGVSKGVVIRIDNYIPNLVATQGRLHMAPEDTDVCLSPYSHAMGLMYCSCTFFFAGDMYICRNELEYVNLFCRGPANITAVQPIYLERLCKDDDFVRAAAEKSFILVGGAPLTRKVYDAYIRAGARILNGYGMTECVAGVAITDRFSGVFDGGMDKMDSAEIAVAPDGEVLVSGSTVCRNYLNGAPVCGHSGIYHTGDAGFIRNGRLYITGRKDNIVVLKNGYKISLESIEDRVSALPEVSLCLAEGAPGGIKISVVSDAPEAVLEGCVQAVLEYYEKPFSLHKVDGIEVYNGKKVRKR